MSAFYRTVRRYQTIIGPDIKEFIISSLALEGIILTESDLEIDWGLVDSVDEKRKWEIEKLKLEVASLLSQDLALVDDIFIYTKILGMSEDEAIEIMDRLDAVEETYGAEIDDIMTQADDLTGEDTDEFDDIDQTADKKQKAKIKAKQADDEKANPTEADLQKYIEEKLGTDDYDAWKKVQVILDKNPQIQETLYNVIVMTQAQLGE